MKKFIGYFFSMLIAIGVGAYGMYYYIGRNPEEVKTRVEKTVTVNENGIADGIDNNLVTRTNTAISVSNGEFNFRVADFQNGVFQSLSYDGHVFTRDQFIGPILKIDGYVFNPIFESQSLSI